MRYSIYRSRKISFSHALTYFLMGLGLAAVASCGGGGGSNPVSYVIVGIWSLVINGWVAGQLAVCVGVIFALGAILTGLSLRTIATYDR